MPNYQEGKIYKIYNTINDDIYVGSTTLKLCERMRDHRKGVNTENKHRPLYRAFSEYGIDNFYIELIEKCPCNDKDELRRKEGEYIRALKPSMNKNIAGRTIREYHTDNKEHIKEQRREYKETNKEYIREKNKEWRENNKEHIKQYLEHNKERILECNKQYRENKKESIKEQKKQYYENNKEYIKSRSGENIACECGRIVTRCCLSRHKKTNRHIKLMNELN
jgi:group I intron endonuclease